MEEYKKLSIEDRCLVHRYLYYVLSSPIISDYDYDMMEREAVKVADESHPIHNVGSDNEETYSEHIKNIAKSFRAM